MNTFIKNYYQMLYAIEQSIEQKLQLPTLTLIYSTIDSLSWVAYGDIGVKKRFTKWIHDYMFRTKKLNVNALDLYAARCAILHTLTPNSDLSNNNQASTLWYSWGIGEDIELEQLIKKRKVENAKVIHINELYESLKLGILQFIQIENLNEDSQKRINQHYENITREQLTKYLKLNN
ncbi:hypothetical protein [Candidatus Marinarcus aquaticus]|uniref:Uncharacterized protein n=1 Tax=Candidatus Marinarcus aquaticus TaxID=2044504 RepID=A0A4Q0XM96_9BACT|nr:hypothetical protein [Candidatus Marinarcus aquaticus]RXJ53794.1 hypothetical protein CRV04_12630 [Candidatus Marinarcus aquaticus]